MAKRIRNPHTFWRWMEKERSRRSEERKVLRDWMAEKISQFDEPDRIWMTLSYGKSYSPKNASEVRRKYIAAMERSPGVGRLSAFWTDPEGPMGNRHSHIVVVGEGLRNIKPAQWEQRWELLAGKGCTAKILPMKPDAINYMTNSRNYYVGIEMQIRGSFLR
jgi:hypothetical protein